MQFESTWRCDSIIAELLLKSLALDYDNAQLYLDLGDVLRINNRPQEAIKYYKLALDNNEYAYTFPVEKIESDSPEVLFDAIAEVMEKYCRLPVSHEWVWIKTSDEETGEINYHIIDIMRETPAEKAADEIRENLRKSG